MYSIVAEPIPLLCPEPSEKILRSALSCFSASIDSFFDNAIVVEYLVTEHVIEVARLIVLIVMLLRLNCFRSELIGMRCFVGGICFVSWRIQWSGWWAGSVSIRRRELWHTFSSARSMGNSPVWMSM